VRNVINQDSSNRDFTGSSRYVAGRGRDVTGCRSDVICVATNGEREN
jgi:hypothetical protein